MGLEVKDISYYQNKTTDVLTDEEKALFAEPRRSINLFLNDNDYRYLKRKNINMSRILFFLAHDWIEKKKLEWGD